MCVHFSPAPAFHRGMPKVRTPALAFILFTVTLDILGIGLIVPILPKLVKQFSGGDTAAASHAAGYLNALYSLMQFAFAPRLGCLSDKVLREQPDSRSTLRPVPRHILHSIQPAHLGNPLRTQASEKEKAARIGLFWNLTTRGRVSRAARKQLPYFQIL